MHYCGQPTTATTASVVAVSDDNLTCEALSMVPVQIPVQTYLVPPMSASTGALVTVAIISVWLMSYAIRAVINTLQMKGQS